MVLYSYMSIERPETARQRAARIWRNHQIQKELHDPTDEEVKSIAHDLVSAAQLEQIEARFRREMREALAHHNKNKSLLQYLLMKLRQRNKNK